jgi:hypothetical protein
MAVLFRGIEWNSPAGLAAFSIPLAAFLFYSNNLESLFVLIFTIFLVNPFHLLNNFFLVEVTIGLINKASILVLYVCNSNETYILEMGSVLSFF